MIVNTGGYAGANADLVKFIVGPRAREVENHHGIEAMSKILAAIAKNPKPSPHMPATNWEEQRSSNFRRQSIFDGRMPRDAPPSLSVSEMFEDEDEAVAVNGPSLDTHEFFESANLLQYWEAVEATGEWWDIESVAEVPDLTDHLKLLGISKIGHLHRLMTTMQDFYPVSPGARTHRLAPRTIARLVAPICEPVYQRDFMVGSFSTRGMWKEKASRVLSERGMEGMSRPVLTRSKAAKDSDAAAFVKTIGKQLKRW